MSAIKTSVIGVLALLACPCCPSNSKNAADAAGVSQPRAPSREFTFHVEGMHCEGCATSLTATLSKINGVTRANVDYASKAAHVWAADEQVIRRALDAIRQSGFYASLDTRRNIP